MRRDDGGRATLLASLGTLYTRGQPVAWEQLHPWGGRCVAAPTYPWQRDRFWLDPTADEQRAGSPRQLRPAGVARAASLVGAPEDGVLRNRGRHGTDAGADGPPGSWFGGPSSGHSPRACFGRGRAGLRRDEALAPRRRFPPVAGARRRAAAHRPARTSGGSTGPRFVRVLRSGTRHVGIVWIVTVVAPRKRHRRYGWAGRRRRRTAPPRGHPGPLPRRDPGAVVLPSPGRAWPAVRAGLPSRGGDLAPRRRGDRPAEATGGGQLHIRRRRLRRPCPGCLLSGSGRDASPTQWPIARHVPAGGRVRVAEPRDVPKWHLVPRAAAPGAGPRAGHHRRRRVPATR